MVATRLLLCPKYGLEGSEVYTTKTTFEPINWRFSIINYALHGILPNDPKEATSIRRRSPQLYYDMELKTLYRRSYDGVLPNCLSNSKAKEVLKEARYGICGAHQPGPNLKDRLRMFGYYWPMMIVDAVQYAKQCKACQIHVNFIHQPPELHHPTITSWPFESWEIDVVGPISPPSVKGHQFILTKNRLLFQVGRSCTTH